MEVNRSVQTKEVVVFAAVTCHSGNVYQAHGVWTPIVITGMVKSAFLDPSLIAEGDKTKLRYHLQVTDAKTVYALFIFSRSLPSTRLSHGLAWMSVASPPPSSYRFRLELFHIGLFNCGENTIAGVVLALLHLRSPKKLEEVPATPSQRTSS